MHHLETDPGPKLDLAAIDIDPHVVRLVPREMARRFHLVAVGREGETLLIAMADPFDVVATDTVSANTGYEVKPAAADANQILAAIDKHYGEEIDIEKSIQKIVLQNAP